MSEHSAWTFRLIPGFLTTFTSFSFCTVRNLTCLTYCWGEVCVVSWLIKIRWSLPIPWMFHKMIISKIESGNNSSFPNDCSKGTKSVAKYVTILVTKAWKQRGVPFAGDTVLPSILRNKITRKGVIRNMMIRRWFSFWGFVRWKSVLTHSTYALNILFLNTGFCRVDLFGVWEDHGKSCRS